jgi:hypothetical protein
MVRVLHAGKYVKKAKIVRLIYDPCISRIEKYLQTKVQNFSTYTRVHTVNTTRGDCMQTLILSVVASEIYISA